MNGYETYQVQRRVGVAYGGSSAYFGRYEPARARTHGWDYIIRMVCSGCGRNLGRFERARHLALCFQCRKFHFPGTVRADDARRFW